MVELKSVWVAYRLSDGKPQAAFPNEALADIFLAGAEASWGYGLMVVELPVLWGTTQPVETQEERRREIARWGGQEDVAA